MTTTPQRSEQGARMTTTSQLNEQGIKLLGVICATRHKLLAFRNPEFDMIKDDRNGEFDDRVRDALSASAKLITSDSFAAAFDKGFSERLLNTSGNEPIENLSALEHQAWVDGWNHASEFYAE